MEIKVRVMIHELAEKENISIRELSRLTDIRPQALNELANQKRQNINFGHIQRIAEAFNIIDINQIITLVITDKDEEKSNTPPETNHNPNTFHIYFIEIP